MDYETLNKAIVGRFSGLSSQLQSAARYVMDRPDDVALMSMRRLAVAADVHPSTMVRLARAFEFKSYNDFRKCFQERLRARPASFLDRARTLQERAHGEMRALFDEMFESNANILHQTFDTNGEDTFEDCAKILSGAKQIYVVGLRSCYPVAFFFHYVCRMFRRDVILLDGQGGTYADNLRNFSADDVILAISVEPYSLQTLRVVEFACDHGGQAVALTDSAISPLAEAASASLLIRNETPSFFDSIVAAMAAVEVLLAFMVAEGGEEALSNIRESEKQLSDFETYWQKKQTSGRGKA